MKVQELKKIIREEVKAAIKEELQDMLNEAVKIASTPSTPSTPVKQPAPKKVNYGTGGLEDLLEDTRSSMSSDDYRNVVSMDSSMVSKPNVSIPHSNFKFELAKLFKDEGYVFGNKFSGIVPLGIEDIRQLGFELVSFDISLADKKLFSGLPWYHNQRVIHILLLRSEGISDKFDVLTTKPDKIEFFYNI